MKCVACGAPLDDDIDLCDECFRVMPVDEMVSASEINDIRNRYKTVEANGTTLILDEDMATNLYFAIASAFGWQVAS